MTVNWTPEPARAKQPPHPRNTMAWILWALSALFIVAWVACMALGIWLDGRVHFLLLGFAVVTFIHVALGFRNVEYFVPLRLTGRLFTPWRARGEPLTPSDLVGDTSSPPATAFASNPVEEDDATPPPQGGLIPDADGAILPGNDPQSGPGQRQPNKVVDAQDPREPDHKPLKP